MQDSSGMQPPSILVVDDTPENIDILKAALKNHYSVCAALNGVTALKIASFNPPPALILLDIMMPEVDGFEVMQILKANADTQDIPVIFITALSDTKNEVKGLQAGAVDYITKPFNPHIVRNRVATHLALRQAKRTLEIINEALFQEHTLVENILIRMRSHKRFDDRHLRYLFSPVDRTNGDILLSAFTPDGRQCLLVGDFTGHGLPAAVAAPLVAHVFYSNVAAGKNLESTLAEINEILYLQLPTGIFMAGSAAEISADRADIHIWSTGMPECLLLGVDGAVKNIIPPTGFPPFGIVAKIDLVGGSEHFSVSSGERLYIFSDGVTETENFAGELFELVGVERFLASYNPSMPLEGLIAQLETFQGSSKFHDDVTFVEIQF